MCPMCNLDVDHLLHSFFDCQFADSCWLSVGLKYNMEQVHSAPSWLLEKLETSRGDEVIRICTVLWGIWSWRNKKVWEDRIISPAAAMESSCRQVKEWRDARKVITGTSNGNGSLRKLECKWRAPATGTFKLNVDASFFAGANSFSIGMVLRDQHGTFVEGRTLSLPCPTTVMEAECLGIREALSWVKVMNCRKVQVESDSLDSIRALRGENVSLLEVGHIIDHCKMLLKDLVGVSVNHIRRQANKVAHGLARIPCSINCHIVFLSPPTHLVGIVSDEYLQ